LGGRKLKGLNMIAIIDEGHPRPRAENLSFNYAYYKSIQNRPCHCQTDIKHRLQH
jgi:hypothetical protein